MADNNFRLPEGTRRLLFDMVPTISFILVFVVIFAAPDGGTFWNRLAQFDGLIAGALAIFAAFITVRQMRSTDRDSERRHDEIMALSLRPNRLAINRAVTPQVPELWELHEKLRTYGDTILESREDVVWKHHYVFKDGVKLRYITLEIMNTVRRNTIKTAMPLLDGNITHWLLETDRLADAAHEILADYVRSFEQYQMADETIVETSQKRLAWLRTNLLMMIDTLPLFLAGLEKLEREYEELG